VFAFSGVARKRLALVRDFFIGYLPSLKDHGKIKSTYFNEIQIPLFYISSPLSQYREHDVCKGSHMPFGIATVGIPGITK
jgi:hypothetical protein